MEQIKIIHNPNNYDKLVELIDSLINLLEKEDILKGLCLYDGIDLHQGVSILHLAKDAYLSNLKEYDLTIFFLLDPFFYGLPRKQKLFNPLCNIFSNLKKCSIPKCHRFILECILSIDLDETDNTNLFALANQKKPSHIPRWEKCKIYLEDPIFWDNLKEDMSKTHPIIIIAILIILKFEIKNNSCIEYDNLNRVVNEYTIYEFETVDSWMSLKNIGSLYTQLSEELQVSEVEDTIKKIRNNSKLVDLLKAYVELVPLEFLNTTEALKICEKGRLKNFKNPKVADTLDYKIISNRDITNRVIVNSYLNRNMYGGANNDKNYYYNMLNHQLYNLNNLLSAEQLKKQKGGNINIEEGSPLDTAKNILMQSQPSYGIRIKGLFEIFKKIKPITPDLEEGLNNYINDIIKNENNLIGIQSLLALILKDETYKENTFNYASLSKIAKEYAKKTNKNDKLVNISLQFLKSKIFPQYDNKLLENSKLLLIVPH